MSISLEQFHDLSVEDQRKILDMFQAKRQPKKLSFKVSDKGGVSVYGINSRFPVTLYLEQWERLFAQIEELKQFCQDHKAVLTTKPIA